MLNKILLLLLAVSAALTAAAQQLYRAKLDPVSAPGFYRIILSPAISALADIDGRDLRLRDEAGRDLPYLKSESRDLRSSSLQLFPIISRDGDGAGRTRITFRNDAARAAQELAVLVRNTSAVRSVSLSGSDDGVSWYSLLDSALLSPGSSGAGDTAISMLSVPRSSYAMLRLTIFDPGLLPPEVVGIGTINGRFAGAKFGALPLPRFVQTDSARKSYIKLQFDLPYPVDRLAFRFEGPPFFKRPASLRVDGTVVAEFDVDHQAAAQELPGLRFREAILEIDNEDNPPLRLRSATASQREQYLLAYLEPGEGRSYALHFGDTALAAPMYDLRHFGDSINRLSVAEISPGAPERLGSVAKKPEAPGHLLGKGTMWAIIIAVIALLMFATTKMVRQLGQRP